MKPTRRHETKLSLFVLVALLMFGTAQLSAQEQQQQEPDEQPPAVTEAESAFVPPLGEPDRSASVRLSDLAGQHVFLNGRPGEETLVATVTDTLVDFGQGALSFLIIQFTDDTIRSPDDEFPVPLYLFRARDGGDGFMLLVDDPQYLQHVRTLEEADEELLPEDEDRAWTRWQFTYWTGMPDMPTTELVPRQDQLHAHWYRYAQGPRVQPVAMMQGSEFIGYPIHDPDGNQIGRIGDAVVNTTTAHLSMVLFEADQALGAEHPNYLVPLTALVGDRESGMITYDLEKLDLAEPSGFGEEWPDITADEVHDQIGEHWAERLPGARHGLGMPIIPVRTIPVTQLMGYDLFTRDSESPGDIVDLLINPDGSVDYAVVEVRGFLGFGGERTVVPVTLLAIEEVSQAAVLSVGVTRLENIPFYERGRVIDTRADDWDAEIRRYWDNVFEAEVEGAERGEIPTVESVEELETGRPFPASALLDYEVVDADGETVGGVRDLYLDLVGSRIGFAVVEATWAGLGIFTEAEIPVPVQAMEWDADEQRFVLPMTSEELERAPGYDDIPDLPGRAFLTEIDEFWGIGS